MTEPHTTLTDGSPVPEDGSHRNLKPNGQQSGYVVLSAEERARGFVEPVRSSYIHVGPPLPTDLRDLTDEEKERHPNLGYVKYQTYGPERSPLIGRYWTQKDLDRLGKGCGGVTTMGIELAETYAANPSFYSGTFCSHCRNHFPVGEQGEFIWNGTNQRVGTRSETKE